LVRFRADEDPGVADALAPVGLVRGGAVLVGGAERVAALPVHAVECPALWRTERIAGPVTLVLLLGQQRALAQLRALWLRWVVDLKKKNQIQTLRCSHG
jgi:hypothetical protein